MPLAPADLNVDDNVTYSVDSNAPHNADGTTAQRHGTVVNAEDRGSDALGSSWVYFVRYRYVAGGTVNVDIDEVQSDGAVGYEEINKA